MVKCGEVYPSSWPSGVPIKEIVGCNSIKKKIQEIVVVVVVEVKEKHDYCSVIEYGLGSVNIVWVYVEFLYFGHLK